MNNIKPFNEFKVVKLYEGLSDKLKPEDLAKKHGVSVEQINKQIKKGVKVEKEHIKDIKTRKRIAMDHLMEYPDYYDRLEKIEENSDYINKYQQWLKNQKMGGEEDSVEDDSTDPDDFTEQELFDFWQMVDLANWTSDHDYGRIQNWFNQTYIASERDLFQAICDHYHGDLDSGFREDWLGDPGIEVSDDSWSDLRAEVVGRGKEFYDNITVEKLQEMALRRDYQESFLYVFH